MATVSRGGRSHHVLAAKKAYGRVIACVVVFVYIAGRKERTMCR